MNLTVAPLRIRRAAPMLVAAAMFTAAGGYIHLRQWLDTYRHVPAEIAGSAVVRVGFPVNTAVSVLLAVALLYCAVRRSRIGGSVVIGSILFEIGSLTTLIVSRTGSVFGWAEQGWSQAASQTRAVEIGALVSLFAIAVLALQQRRNERFERRALLVAP